jgi:D-sedoheptulose 7-phosphate isomerase
MNFKKSKLFERYPILNPIRTNIEESYQILKTMYEKGGKLMVMGNGGSSADSEHLCGELMKGFLSKRPLRAQDRAIFDRIDPAIAPKLQRPLAAMSLVVAHGISTAFANDVDPDFVFAQQIYGLAKPEDVVVGISTSGNSRNVIWGFKAAKALGVKTIALTGENGGESKKWTDCMIQVPGNVTHEVQELHLPVYHALCIELEEYFFGG